MPYQSEFIVNKNSTTIIIQNKKQHWKYQKRKIAYNPLTFCTDLCCCFFSVYFVFPVLPPAFVRCIQRHRPRPWWMNEWKQPTSSSSSHPLSTKSFLWQVRPCRKRNAKFYYSFHKKHTYIHIRTNLISKFYVKYCLTPSKPIRFDCYEMLLPLAIIAPSHVACVFTLSRC